MAKKKEKPAALKRRKPMPPPVRVQRDRKKESRRTMCRGHTAERRAEEWGRHAET
jgi:hypothetical protein